MNISIDTSMSDLPRRLEQAVRDESPSAVAALFTDDGSFWIADERAPSGTAAVGKDGIEQLFTGWFSAIQLQLSIADALHSADAGDGQLLQSGVFSRKITVRETGDNVDERGGYVRLVTQVNGAVTETAEDLATRYLDLGDVDGAVWAARRGLEACKTHGRLTKLLMEAHLANGDAEAARRVFESHQAAMEEFEIEDLASDGLVVAYRKARGDQDAAS